MNLGEDTLLLVFLATVDSGLEVRVVGIHHRDFLDVGTELVGDFLCHDLGVAGLGVVEDQHLGGFLFRGFFLGTAGYGGQRHDCKEQYQFGAFHRIVLLFQDAKLLISRILSRRTSQASFLRKSASSANITRSFSAF